MKVRRKDDDGEASLKKFVTEAKLSERAAKCTVLMRRGGCLIV